MKAVVEEIFINEGLLNLSLVVAIDEYDPLDNAPRVILLFNNGADRRRLPLPNLIIRPDSEGGALAYGSYAYTIEKLFWDCSWKSFDLDVEVEYGNRIFESIPITYDQVSEEIKIVSDSRLKVLCGPYSNIHMRDFSPIHMVLIFVLRLLKYILGICLIPVFLLDGIFNLLPGYDEERALEGNGSLGILIRYLGRRFFRFCGLNRGVIGFYEDIIRVVYHLRSSFCFKKTGILFVSNRRPDMTGNFEYVYDKLKDKKVPFRFWLKDREPIECNIFSQIDFALKAAKSRIILVDDFIPILARMNLSRKTSVVQLWHACGAFKTFGFSRLGKKGAPNQRDESHRIYDAVFVSSSGITKYYSEGFGVDESHIYPYGVPRTDVFFDDEYAAGIRAKLYDQYPSLKGKKVLLFAPTFRGNGKQSAYYEKSAFDPNYLMDRVPEEYVLIIKHHPFVELKYEIKDRFKDRIYDFSGESEINDLLFITDLVITDYSSVIYETSILNIPMLFYAYDQEAYLATRDFYPGFQKFVPGKIVRNMDDLALAIKNNDCNQEKVEAFYHDNFDMTDGKTSERIADYLMNLLQG